MKPDNEHFDDIVVGAGTAGAIIASRLSENPHRRVLLLEAGPDYPAPEALPPALLDVNTPVMNGHNWHLPAQIREVGALRALGAAGCALLQASASDRGRLVRAALHSGPGNMPAIGSFDYNVGKVVGGSSAINGSLALRGIPEDYDEWRAFTDGAWSWERVEAAFRALEADQDASPAASGRAGPVPIRRERESELTPLQAAFIEASQAAGFPLSIDHNDARATGVGLVPKAAVGRRRMSTALTHLAEARRRPNLTVLAGTHADRLRWRDATTCDGIDVIVNGQRRALSADRVILCAGALNSPAILMRSGVGDPAHLKSLAIRPHLSLPGVGSNLIDHAVAAIWGVPRPEASRLGEPTHQALLRYTCEGSAYRNDMHIYMLSGIDTGSIPMLGAALGAPTGVAVAACLMKPRSQGCLRLVSADPLAAPHIVVNCLGDPEDGRRLKDGIRVAWNLIQAEQVRARIDRVFAWNESMIRHDAALDRALSTFVRPGWHVVGTARMGRADDPGAVVGSDGRVHGTENLWVADASIMPTVPSAPTSPTCMIIGELIAAGLAA